MLKAGHFRRRNLDVNLTMYFTGRRILPLAILVDFLGWVPRMKQVIRMNLRRYYIFETESESRYLSLGPLGMCTDNVVSILHPCKFSIILR
jgi:hypothetical protein